MIRPFLALLALTAPALASAPQTPPDTATARGCTVILPSPRDEDRPATLQVRTIHPMNECDGSAPVSFGASIRDSGTGRAR